MTENEAIRMLEDRLKMDVIEHVPEYAEAMKMAVSALKENTSGNGTPGRRQIWKCGRSWQRRTSRWTRWPGWNMSNYPCSEVGDFENCTD